MPTEVSGPRRFNSTNGRRAGTASQDREEGPPCLSWVNRVIFGSFAGRPLVHRQRRNSRHRTCRLAGVRGHRTIPHFLAGSRRGSSGLRPAVQRSPYHRIALPGVSSIYAEIAGFVYARGRASSLRNDLSDLTLKVLPSSVNTRAERKRERNRLKTELPTRSVSAYS